MPDPVRPESFDASGADPVAATPDVSGAPTQSTTPAPEADNSLAEMRAAMIQIVRENSETRALLMEGLAQLAGRNAAPTGAPVYTEEQLQQLIDEGKMTPLQAGRIIAKQEAEAAAGAVKRDHVDPLAGRMDIGINALSATATELARQKMPHYDRFAEETRKNLDRMAPELKVHPDGVNVAHRLTLGMHMEELEREAFERGVRAARENPQTVPSGRLQNEKGEEVPSAADLFKQGVLDATAVASVKQAGGEEAFVQKYFRGRYTSWAEYAALMVNGPEGSA